MKFARSALPVAALAVIVATCAVAVAASEVRVTPSGAGAVKLGKTYTGLRSAGLLGKLRTGCELAGPNTRGAALRPPMRGSVDLTRTFPRRVTRVTVTAGASARGVGIGATADALRAAFPKATFDRSLEGTFDITIARVPKSGGGRLEFGLDPDSQVVTLVGIPSIGFCE